MIDQSLFKKKELYPFQKKIVNQIVKELLEEGENFNLLFQLPTGGGKTVIFSNIAKESISKKQVVKFSFLHIELNFVCKLQSNYLLWGSKIR